MSKERTVRLTPTGKARLEDELHTLVTVKKPDLAVRIQEATEHGDISDNSEYEALKEEFVLVEARIHELEQTLDHAEVIAPASTDGAVGLGSRVTLRSDDGEEETWILVSPEEAHTSDGSISTESPVGRSLVGRRIGDSAPVQTPAGTIVYTVVNVA